MISGPKLGDPFVSWYLIELYIPFSETDDGLYIYHLVVRSNFTPLYNSLWIAFHTLSYILLNSFYTICLIHLLYAKFFRLFLHWTYTCNSICNILTSDSAVNRETGASGRRHQDIALTEDGLNSVQMRHSQEAGVCKTIILPGATDRFSKLESLSWR